MFKKYYLGYNIDGDDIMHFYKDNQNHFYVQLDDEKTSEKEFHLIREEEHQGDASKHLPLITRDKQYIQIKIGDIMHPMTPEHHISMVFLKTKQGGQYKVLSYQSSPIVEFYLSDKDEPVEVYGYCNLHGLWKQSF